MHCCMNAYQRSLALQKIYEVASLSSYVVTDTSWAVTHES
jgi:hypothetical protein